MAQRRPSASTGMRRYRSCNTATQPSGSAKLRSAPSTPNSTDRYSKPSHDPADFVRLGPRRIPLDSRSQGVISCVNRPSWAERLKIFSRGSGPLTARVEASRIRRAGVIGGHADISLSAYPAKPAGISTAPSAQFFVDTASPRPSRRRLSRTRPAVLRRSSACSSAGRTRLPSQRSSRSQTHSRCERQNS
jgi:hypothetical protein